MSDLFKKEDVIALLRGKTVLILGGSIQRGIYKDLIWLMNSNTLINKGVRLLLCLFKYVHVQQFHIFLAGSGGQR